MDLMLLYSPRIETPLNIDKVTLVSKSKPLQNSIFTPNSPNLVYFFMQIIRKNSSMIIERKKVYVFYIFY